jgi:hypothetical protein
MTLNEAQPLFDTSTHYRIEVRGRVDVEWLQGFDSSVEISVDKVRLQEGITVLTVKSDQAGIVGLVRRLHGVGMAIMQVQVVTSGDDAAQSEE